ncbi:hypothetical protein MJO28_005620 [Puccinia striiformis f. sp. tritici]|uniref:DUF6589 domain-containing protein n=2 Tax=Puccinia striiformis f. sp. tritici TaxID=168172 RepID=A0A0L0V1C9_9BASI|nr:hypothetical protein Pst134EB_010855 [Puccinia striiformis f. sp. tritici]KAH9462519.1 hypothetical protein Pst134EB_006411 [Puccinia striiformis f. sp. tritici]KAI7955220.1 hypothetical protein MJO28_005620 [Puccinia striiformis f. sp. tritici]KNE92986.1 hypothetical protein PSTG_13623 [Puccinia striiformis f. sp. tritici PST-78]
MQSTLLTDLRTKYDKIFYICQILQKLDLNPKKFIVAFLTMDEIPLADRRQFWGTGTGWLGTQEVLHAIRHLAFRSQEGKCLWREFILEEAKKCVHDEVAKTGEFPKGAYYNANKMDSVFFNDNAREDRESTLINHDMPFLYELIYTKISNSVTSGSDDNKSKSDHPIDGIDNSNNLDGVLSEATFDDPSSHVIEKDHKSHEKACEIRKQRRSCEASRTICAMIAFGENRRNNAMQISNSLTFLACGVTERVNNYLHYIGLTSARDTAHVALKALGEKSKKIIRDLMSVEQCPHIAPIICIDNIDFEERIHSASPDKKSTMFHGTWGYIHRLDLNLLEGFDLETLKMQSVARTLRESTNMVIEPSLFLPTETENLHFKAVIKSQIARVLLDYIATSSAKNSNNLVLRDPPPIDQIKAAKPDIHMLKMMVASDNSSAGVDEVLTSIIRQSGLTPEEFYGRFQLMEGDLGTCLNLESLRALRKPSGFAENSLSNIIMLMGASHTLWNISQAIFIHHFGKPNNANDQGAWRTLSALNLPCDKPIAKNDFTSMINNIQKIHEVTILECLLQVMGISKTSLPNTKVAFPPETLNKIIDLCYNRFFGPNVIRDALKNSSSRYYNLLLRLRDFSTIVEANRAMQAGDIGRLLNMWRRWAVMTQGMKSLKHYKVHLPRMILLITKVLPPALCRLIQHSLLITPSGRPNHFVAKDFYLEVQNYWIKYFYNHNGIGTNINRLKDVFSINIPLLQSLVQAIKFDSGIANFHQSTKHRISLQAINAFQRMANQFDICSPLRGPIGTDPTRTDNIFKLGVLAMVEDIKGGSRHLNKFRPSAILSTHNIRDSEDVSDQGDHLDSSNEISDPYNELGSNLQDDLGDM